MGKLTAGWSVLGGGYVWTPTASPPRQASLLPLSDIASWGLVQTVESLLLDILRGRPWEAFLQIWALHCFSKERPEVRGPQAAIG